MANPERPADVNDEVIRPHAHRDWATIKARARLACDGLKEQMDRVTAELAQSGDVEELWKALWECPDVFAQAAALEVEARSVYDHLVLDLQVLDNDIEELEAELFLYYNREMANVGGGHVTEPTVDAIKAAITADIRAAVKKTTAYVKSLPTKSNVVPLRKAESVQ